MIFDAIPHVLIAISSLLLALMCTERDDQGMLHFGYLSLIWGYLFAGSIGSLAGMTSGARTVKISGGIDPEYETIPVRYVADSKRLDLVVTWGTHAILPIGIGLLCGALIVNILSKRQVEFPREKWNALRTNCSILFLLIQFFCLRTVFEG